MMKLRRGMPKKSAVQLKPDLGPARSRILRTTASGHRPCCHGATTTRQQSLQGPNWIFEWLFKAVLHSSQL